MINGRLIIQGFWLICPFRVPHLRSRFHPHPFNHLLYNPSSKRAPAQTNKPKPLEIHLTVDHESDDPIIKQIRFVSESMGLPCGGEHCSIVCYIVVYYVVLHHIVWHGITIERDFVKLFHNIILYDTILRDIVVQWCFHCVLYLILSY